ncbi:hypothetical protein [Alkalicoccobacillus plakortidis]|uniref:Uncharacterized protein n=1 Tax=Alkalicoccobacillus plakortidis TaxID=444060 RepID=A0ABT0XEH2_9BACI|nr:hypothetical protein [Alkalicoccobacillus plakortidis]MCM2674299.1 hypothetical protein [Alkalicoccobacillus plakortidis]
MSSAEKKTRSTHFDDQETASLPPRGEVGQRKRQRRKKASAFPLAKILLILFLLLVGLMIFFGPRLF